ncbi:uncharacterized protein LOC117106228 [Anneissia japonica]|uniref:uncharacterized protein LOC117106228 n=1 Tax=Anneissia japonica TaxID=1529436 RepID=UPI001425AA71|nr:uncharacterized protein LOC117106228 [Anneissia japonica]
MIAGEHLKYGADILAPVIAYIIQQRKTEYTIIKRDENEEWRKTKKIGSLLGDSEDIARRKQLASVSFNPLYTIWIRKDKVKEKVRLKLYNVLVKPILTYNSATWGLTKEEERKLDSFHRKHLRKIIGIRYQHKIKNTKLYDRCKVRPISLDILEFGWRLFGHILRLQREVPANKAINYYFENSKHKKYRGRSRTTLPVTLSNDLITLHKQLPSALPPMINNLKDVETIRRIAESRHDWRRVILDISKAAEAGKSSDYLVDRQ